MVVIYVFLSNIPYQISYDLLLIIGHEMNFINSINYVTCHSYDIKYE